jgi:hypothetical protein
MWKFLLIGGKKTYHCYSTVVLSKCQKAWACCLTPVEEEDNNITMNWAPYPLSLMNHLLLSTPPTPSIHSNTPASTLSTMPSSPTPGSPLTDVEELEEEASFLQNIPRLDLSFDFWENEDDIIINLGMRANSGRYKSLYFMIYNQIM